MKDDSKTIIIGISAVVVLAALYFIFCKPETADPIISLISAFLGFLGGAVGALLNAIKI